MSGCRRIWMPIYICLSVIEALRKYHVDFVPYNIDKEFLPEVISIPEDDILLAANYFGVKNSSFYSSIVSKYKRVIFDNTQAFFAEPIIQENVYNIYSPRKFFGVSDGAYLIGKSLQTTSQYGTDFSAERCSYLLASYERGTELLYETYLFSEESLGASGILHMSKLTKGLLGTINYQEIKQIRIHNYYVLHDLLKSWNALSVQCELSQKCVPMVYPFLYDGNDLLREYLVSNRVYVPQWWKWILDEKKTNGFERMLSNYLYPLPIDQRYTVEDMRAIASIVAGGK